MLTDAALPDFAWDLASREPKQVFLLIMLRLKAAP
jgi:hypothetical protein